MIIDTFMFSGMGADLDLLDFRLHELEDKVDLHVLVESPWTHRGVEKPLIYQENKARYAEWANRIIPVVADRIPHLLTNPDKTDKSTLRLEAWAREHAQRDSMVATLEDLTGPGDRILISDLDEFPSDTALAWNERGAVAMLQRTFHSAVDWEYPVSQYTSVMAQAEYALEKGLAATRDNRYNYPVISDGGWHFSWLGGTEALQTKLAVTCHLEMGNDEYNDLHSGASWTEGQHHAGDATVKAVEVDKTWPKWIQDRKCPPSWFRPRP